MSGVGDICPLPYMVTGNYQPHLTTLFLPDPIILTIRALHVRACPHFPEVVSGSSGPVSLDPGLVALKPSWVYPHLFSLPCK
jgi:hypothetical protein